MKVWHTSLFQIIKRPFFELDGMGLDKRMELTSTQSFQTAFIILAIPIEKLVFQKGFQSDPSKKFQKFAPSMPHREYAS